MVDEILEGTEFSRGAIEIGKLKLKNIVVRPNTGQSPKASPKKPSGHVISKEV